MPYYLKRFDEELIIGYPAFENRIKDLEDDSKIKNLFILFQANETETRQALCPHCNSCNSHYSCLSLEYLSFSLKIFHRIH